MGEFFWVFKLEFPIKSFKKICSSPPSFGKRMKPLRCFIGGFSSLKKILRASQTWKLAIGIIGKYSNTPCAGFATGFCGNLETCTLC
jgi:hypothetical protein